MAASNDRLGNLHALFVSYWELRFLQASMKGEQAVPLSAAELAVVRAFLKDNSIFGDPDASGDLDELAKTMRNQLKESGVGEAELDSILADFTQFQKDGACLN